MMGKNGDLTIETKKKKKKKRNSIKKKNVNEVQETEKKKNKIIRLEKENKRQKKRIEALESQLRQRKYNYKGVKCVLLRGPSAVGKTQISSSLVLKMKELGLRPMSIHTDNFRGKLQRKFKAADDETTRAHRKSVGIVTATVDATLENNGYDVVVIEGLVRMDSMISQYSEYCSERGMDFFIFHCSCPFDTRQKRDVKEGVRAHDVGLRDKDKPSDNEIDGRKGIVFNQHTGPEHWEDLELSCVLKELDTQKEINDNVDYILECLDK